MIPPFLVPRWALVGGGCLLVVLALWISIASYGRARYKAGVADTDLAWKTAAETLKAQSEKSGEDADLDAATRAADYTAKLQQEKGRLDEAAHTGASALDVLFDGGGVQDNPGGGPAPPGP